MNPLRILLLLVIVLYLTVYHFNFWKYFFIVLIPYYIMGDFVLFDPKLNTPRRKALISLWNEPSDPLAYATSKLDLSKLELFVKELSSRVEEKVGISIAMIKIFGNLLEKYPQLNGNIIFGKFVKRESCDISVLVGCENGTDQEIITLTNCNKMSLQEIAKTISDKRKAIENKTDSVHNRKKFFSKLLPTFLLSPFIRILSYLSICGLDLSWLWLPKYAYGNIMFCNLGTLGIDGAFIPIPNYTNISILLCLAQKKTKKKIDPVTLSLQEKTSVIMHTSMDHRFLDGSLASKILLDIEAYLSDPSKLLL